ncbi:MAG: Glutamine--tRNA ligase [Verrucomicrobia subdivision 3 bacterium]|nr:Glutamine--tRNA ligase [Limisphaerales bacterium]MCS1416420.1 Glutamine--tRNA ligase [Limisphaerales bacterium]
MTQEQSNKPDSRKDFIREIVAQDLEANTHGGKVVTRFPPEPNGYLHIGHAKSICLNFGIAAENQGVCHLRFDDTNPARENDKFVNAIEADMRWLGFDWGDLKFFASNYFEKLYGFAVDLIQAGKAFVCDQTAAEFVNSRGTPTRPGTESPWRHRSVEENLDLFSRMRQGEFEDSAKTLRAKIDMTSPNIHLRDPALYRIRKIAHHRTGDAWSIYPTYDFAHCLSDAIEGITHSICTLEFAVHRPLYDWMLENVPLPRPRPRQYEFARLNLSYTVLSKRKLIHLVDEKIVWGWDDPRMPTISGLRRRGITPDAIKTFCATVGVTKYDGLTEAALFEHCIRSDLNQKALRAMAVLKPLKVTIDNLPEGYFEELEAINNPENETAGNRSIPFSNELYIEETDFMETPPKKFFRLRPGGEVRLRYAYIMKCQEVVKNADGSIHHLHCTIDPDSKRGGATAGRRVKGTIHWVSATHAINAEVRLFDRLFTVEDPANDASGKEFTEFINPQSLTTLANCKLEPSLAAASPEAPYQFERTGYFCLDARDSTESHLVFNRTIALRDSWTAARQRTHAPAGK